LSEKKLPHYSLDTIREYIERGDVLLTRSALIGGAEVDLDSSDIKRIVTSLSRGDFYKSMTAHQNHTIWHDVYHKRHGDVHLYIKVQLLDQAVVISFKER
jgi:motility quorum-sensing regulator/GCU-specific mRNA interferase toxin